MIPRVVWIVSSVRPAPACHTRELLFEQLHGETTLAVSYQNAPLLIDGMLQLRRGDGTLSRVVVSGVAF